MKAATLLLSKSTAGAAFQSTPPVKAATHHGFAPTQHGSISIHAAREGGDGALPEIIAAIVISIHAAREGGDINPRMPNAKAYISIHAAREGGDGFKVDPSGNSNISIHAAREGGDVQVEYIRLCGHDFNPRRP